MVSVAARASRISSLDRCGDSLRNAEHTHAPAHACLTYSAKGHDVIQNASASGVLSTTQRPGGTNCGLPIARRL